MGTRSASARGARSRRTCWGQNRPDVVAGLLDFGGAHATRHRHRTRDGRESFYVQAHLRCGCRIGSNGFFSWGSDSCLSNADGRHPSVREHNRLPKQDWTVREPAQESAPPQRSTLFLLDGTIARRLRLRHRTPVELLILSCTCVAYAVEHQDFAVLPCADHTGVD